MRNEVESEQLYGCDEQAEGCDTRLNLFCYILENTSMSRESIVPARKYALDAIIEALSVQYFISGAYILYPS